MDSRAHRVVAHTVGYLFASVGFFLSVLSVLFNILNSVPSPSSEDTSTALTIALGRRQTRQLHVPAEKVNEETSTSPRGPPTIPRSTAADSKTAGTIPLVPTLPQRTEDPLPPSLKRKPTVITFVKDMHTDSFFPPRTANSTPSERVLVHSDCEEPSRSLLSHLNPLRAKRSKLHRCSSSPHLASPHLTSKPPLSLPDQNQPREHAPVKKKRSSPFRKESRTPSTPRSVSCSLAKKNSVEKKKSQPLRTQPYEAPYFFPPPVASPQRSPSRSGST